MKFGKSLLTVILTLLSVACSQQRETGEKEDVVQNPTYGEWQDREQPPIRFELDQTYGSEKDEDGFMFSSSGGIVGPVADGVGNIYVLDRVQSKLLSFDPDGKLRWQTGQEGKGPGDFFKVRGIAINDSSLYLDNVEGTRIDQYDLKGTFIRNMSLASEDLSLMNVEGFLSNSLLVTSSTIWGTFGNRISVFDIDSSLKKVSQFDVEVLKSVDMNKGLASSLSVSVVDSLIVFGNLGNYEINFYNVEGKKIKSVTRDFDRLVRPGIYSSGSRRAMRMFRSLESPAQITDEYLLTTLSWPTNVNDPNDFTRKSLNGNAPDVQYSMSMDLFRSDGTLLYSLEEMDKWRPDIGDIAYVDSKGNLYTGTNDPYPQIRRYRVIIQEE